MWGCRGVARDRCKLFDMRHGGKTERGLEMNETGIGFNCYRVLFVDFFCVLLPAMSLMTQ